jgi:1,4-dihydroxy-2-naphthoyl-CoA synthase
MITTQNLNEHVRIEANEDTGVATIVLERPARRNAVDRPTAEALSAAFRRFEAEPAWQYFQVRRKRAIKQCHSAGTVKGKAARQSGASKHTPR